MDTNGEISKECMRACTYMDTIIGHPTTYKSEAEEPSFTTIFFSAIVPVRDSHLVYDFVSLFAEIGGYTGLLIGVSALDFAKIFTFCSERISNIVFRLNRNN